MIRKFLFICMCMIMGAFAFSCSDEGIYDKNTFMPTFELEPSDDIPDTQRVCTHIRFFEPHNRPGLYDGDLSYLFPGHARTYSTKDYDLIEYCWTEDLGVGI